MKTLQTLIKVSDKKLEDQQRKISELESYVKSLKDKQLQLEESSSKGIDNANASGDITILQAASTYLQRAKIERAALQSKVQEVEPIIEAERALLRNLFAEKKRYEALLKRRENEERLRLQKLQQASLDDIAGSTFGRK